MFKKIGIILLFTTIVGARHAVPLQDLAFATLQDDGQPCPPECTIDTMEIVTWYPSPYNEYEELRLYPTQRDPGDCDNDKIGLMYYDHGGTPSFPEDDKIKICKGISLGWEDMGASFWQQLSGDDISNTNSGKVTINGNMQADDIYLTTLGKWLSQVIPVNLANAVHTSAQCYDLGGTLVDDGTGKKMCKFNGSSCPSGWSQYQSWCSTSANSGTYTTMRNTGCIMTYDPCNTMYTETCVVSGHPFLNSGPQSTTCYGGQSCGYWNSDGTFYTCASCVNSPIKCFGSNVTITEGISEVGCY